MAPSGLPSQDEFQLLRAQPHFGRLRDLAHEVERLGDEFMPIYLYYFPESWLTVIARTLHLAKQPDFSRYRAELKQLRDTAFRIAADAKIAAEAIVASNIAPAFREAARVTFDLIHTDCTLISLMHEWVGALDKYDEQAFLYLAGMREYAKRGRANRKRMIANAAALREYLEARS